MKKIIIALLFSTSLYSMQRGNHNEDNSLQGMFSSLEDDSRIRELGRIQRENAHLHRLLELQNRIDSAHNEDERLVHIVNKTRYEQEHDRLETERLIGSTSSWKADNKIKMR